MKTKICIDRKALTYIILYGRVATSLIIRSGGGEPLIRNVTRHIALFALEGPFFTK